jgi:hypothetical protein
MVEYAPAVVDAVLVEEAVRLDIMISSAIDPGSVQVTGGAIGTPPENSADVVILSFTPGSNGVSINLEPSYNIMSQATWALGPEELEFRYGKTHRDWESFVEITLNAKAPNGVPLRGNLGGDLLWPDQASTRSVPPYLINSGRGGAFKVKIPTIPEFICCMPTLDFGEGSIVQNGCSCSHVSNPDKCENYGCCWTDGAGVRRCQKDNISRESCDYLSGDFQIFTGQTRKWANCCSTALNCDIFVDELLDVRPVCDPGAPDVPFMTRKYQYKLRPYDTNLPAQCDPIMMKQACVID